MRQALKDFAAAAGLVLVCALLALALPVQAQVPQAAQQYRALLVRTAHAAWGLDAPVAGAARAWQLAWNAGPENVPQAWRQWRALWHPCAQGRP